MLQQIMYKKLKSIILILSGKCKGYEENCLLPSTANGLRTAQHLAVRA